MGLMFKDETYRGDFTFYNSPEAIRHFPFPFHEDKYMYAVNIEPHTPGPKDTLRVPDRRGRALCLRHARPRHRSG